MSTDAQPLRIGISMGDMNGISMEVIMRVLHDNRMLQVCTPIVYGATKVASFYRKQLQLNDFSFQILKPGESPGNKQPALINVWDEELTVEPGADTELAGKLSLSALERACADMKAGLLDALVTAPLNKHNVSKALPGFKGHTEFLGSFFQGKPLMMMVSGNLRVVPLTGHVPLQEVPRLLTRERLQAVLKQTTKSLLEDFGIRKPRIAVLGLNPHAGEQGLLGKEEQEIIHPTLEALRQEGQLVFGPFPADGFFGNGTFASYDAVLAMYHDQALIPFKTMAFESGVNYTAGLSVVRTSPDHGTAYDLAGKGTASEQSLRQAIFLAIDVTRQRSQYAELTANPLKITQQRRER